MGSRRGSSKGQRQGEEWLDDKVGRQQVHSLVAWQPGLTTVSVW